MNIFFELNIFQLFVFVFNEYSISKPNLNIQFPFLGTNLLQIIAPKKDKMNI